MKRRLLVPSEYASVRLDLFLRNFYPDISREKLKNAIKKGGVCYFCEDSKKFVPLIKPSFKLSPSLLLEIDEATFVCSPTELKPEKMALDILYEDDYILAINKPSGVLVHPGAGVYSGTIANGVLFYLKDKISWISGRDRPGIVHRLDKDTSGVLLIAKNDFVHMKLAQLFEKRKIKKFYLALVDGLVEFDEDLISAPIEHDPFCRDRFRVGWGILSKEAVTEYKVLIRDKERDLTLLLVRLHTGRTHQIRVHMKYIGHPIIGDKKYNTLNKSTELGLNMCLHAYMICFSHPTDGREVKIKTPLPKFVLDYDVELDF